MTRHVCFLRAINVAGHAMVKMTDLKVAFGAAGCENVATYIQSGNVVFESPDDRIEVLAVRIRAKLKALLGQEPEIILRTARELDAIIRAAPFKALEGRRDVKLYVVFLSEKPRKKPSFPLDSAKEALSAVGIKNRAVFVVSRQKKNGFFGFPNAFVESELGVSATSRNWSTVTKIAGLLREDASRVRAR